LRRYIDGQLHSIITNGLFTSGMPPARGILSDEEMWRIVLYIRHLPPAGSPASPRCTARSSRTAALADSSYLA
jgi:mono/diheme cytochrome c family protein